MCVYVQFIRGIWYLSTRKIHEYVLKQISKSVSRQMFCIRCHLTNIELKHS